MRPHPLLRLMSHRIGLTDALAPKQLQSGRYVTNAMPIRPTSSCRKQK
jgi:hypothetical protein